MLCRRLFLAVSFVSSALALAAPARAADFRVDNAIYLEGESKPQSHGATIFCNGMVYDFVDEPAEIVVCDKSRQRFVLLDPGRRVQSEISMDEVKNTIDQLQKMIAKNSNPQLQWLGNPTFDETLDRENSQLTLRHEWMTYKAWLLPAGPGVAQQYRVFCDWYAQLNHVLDPESRPPFARMKLNDAMERNQGIAKEVRLTTDFAKTPGPATIISRHQLAAQLGESDKKRIAGVEESMKTFQHMTLQEYTRK